MFVKMGKEKSIKRYPLNPKASITKQKKTKATRSLIFLWVCCCRRQGNKNEKREEGHFGNLVEREGMLGLERQIEREGEEREGEERKGKERKPLAHWNLMLLLSCFFYFPVSFTFLFPLLSCFFYFPSIPHPHPNTNPIYLFTIIKFDLK